MSRMVYFLKKALAYLLRNPVVASVTVGTVAVVFLVLGIFALLGHNLALAVDRLGSGLQLTVFLEDDCTPPDRAALHSALESSPEVEAVAFIDRDQALARFRKRFGPQASVLEGLGDNPLPASLEATFRPASRTPARIGSVAQKVVNLSGVEEVQYGQAWLERFFQFLETARYLGLFIGLLIVLAALMIVSNTIRLSVYARREEIVILKLVGATDRFIKAPFYLEGLLLGLAGAGLGTALTWAVFVLLLPKVLVPIWFGEGRLTVEFLPFAGVTWMVVGGAMLGVLGTMTSLWRHLKI